MGGSLQNVVPIEDGSEPVPAESSLFPEILYSRDGRWDHDQRCFFPFDERSRFPSVPHRLFLRLYGRSSLPSGGPFHPSCRGLHPGRTFPNAANKAAWVAPNLVPGLLGRGLGARVGGGGPPLSKGSWLLGCGMHLRGHLPELGCLAGCFSNERPASRRGWHAAGLATGLMINGGWGLGTALLLRGLSKGWRSGGPSNRPESPRI